MSMIGLAPWWSMFILFIGVFAMPLLVFFLMGLA